MNFADPPAARIRAQYSLSSGPSSGVVQYSLWLKNVSGSHKKLLRFAKLHYKDGTASGIYHFQGLISFPLPYIHPRKAPSFISIILPVSRMLRKRPFEGFVYFFGDQPGTFCIRVHAIGKQAPIVLEYFV